MAPRSTFSQSVCGMAMPNGVVGRPVGSARTDGASVERSAATPPRSAGCRKRWISLQLALGSSGTCCEMSHSLGERVQHRFQNVSCLLGHALFVTQTWRRSQDVDQLDHEAFFWMVLVPQTSLLNSGAFINARHPSLCPNLYPKVSGVETLRQSWWIHYERADATAPHHQALTCRSVRGSTQFGAAHAQSDCQIGLTARARTWAQLTTHDHRAQLLGHPVKKNCSPAPG